MNRSAVLTPSEISVCSDDDIVISCHESDTTAIMYGLQWEVIPANLTLFRFDIILSISLNKTQRQEYGQIFYSEITSYSPLVAIFTTTAHPVLHGATVSCASPTSMDILTISVLEAGNVKVLMLFILITRSFMII